MTTISHDASKVETKADLVRFVGLLAQSLRENPSQLENDSVDRYLEALSAWVEDADGYYIHKGRVPLASPTWRLIAEMLAAAIVYE